MIFVTQTKSLFTRLFHWPFDSGSATIKASLLNPGRLPVWFHRNKPTVRAAGSREQCGPAVETRVFDSGRNTRETLSSNVDFKYGDSVSSVYFTTKRHETPGKILHRLHLSSTFHLVRFTKHHLSMLFWVRGSALQDRLSTAACSTSRGTSSDGLSGEEDPWAPL